jgi:hypothetical protein
MTCAQADDGLTSKAIAGLLRRVAGATLGSETRTSASNYNRQEFTHGKSSAVFRTEQVQGMRADV